MSPSEPAAPMGDCGPEALVRWRATHRSEGLRATRRWSARLLEGQDGVCDLLAVARLLHIGDLAAAAVGDAGFGDLFGHDGVVRLDVLGPHDAGDDQVADL